MRTIESLKAHIGELEAANQVLDPPDRGDQLKIRVVDGRLVISIGVETLAIAAKYSNFFDDPTMKELEILDAEAFAREIARQLAREEEDGTTLVHHALDKAAELAVENGAEGVEWEPDPQFGQELDEAAFGWGAQGA